MGFELICLLPHDEIWQSPLEPLSYRRRRKKTAKYTGPEVCKRICMAAGPEESTPRLRRGRICAKLSEGHRWNQVNGAMVHDLRTFASLLLRSISVDTMPVSSLIRDGYIPTPQFVKCYGKVALHGTFCHFCTNNAVALGRVFPQTRKSIPASVVSGPCGAFWAHNSSC